jgi:hypothetical protein
LALGIVSARLQAAKGHALSPKLRPKPKILAPHRYMISVNAQVAELVKNFTYILDRPYRND